MARLLPEILGTKTGQKGALINPDRILKEVIDQVGSVASIDDKVPPDIDIVLYRYQSEEDVRELF